MHGDASVGAAPAQRSCAPKHPLRAQVEAAGDRVEAELGAVLAVATGVWRDRDALPALRPVAVFDPVNNAVWLKAPARSQARAHSPCACVTCTIV